MAKPSLRSGLHAVMVCRRSGQSEGLSACAICIAGPVHTHTLTLESGFSHRSPAALSQVWATQQTTAGCSLSARRAHQRPRHHVGETGRNPEEKGLRRCRASSSMDAHQPPGGTPAALGSVGALLVSRHMSVWIDIIYFRVPLLSPVKGKERERNLVQT